MFRVTVNTREIDALPADAQRALRRAFPAAVKRTVAITREEAPKRSHHLERAIRAEMTGPTSADIIASALNHGFDYGEGLTTGTGIFGPKQTRIRPRRARALGTPYGARRSIAGMKPNRYDLRAADRAEQEAPQAFEEALTL